MPVVEPSSLPSLPATAGSVVGPLSGYHHEAYAVRLATPGLFGMPTSWVKFRDPRPGLLWFDRRCFTSEDALLTALVRRVSRVPEVARVDSVTVHSFVEGCTLAEITPPGGEVPAGFVDQIILLFRELLSLDPYDPSLLALHPTPPEDRNSEAFAHALVRFTLTEVVERSLSRFDVLFHSLGVHPESARTSPSSLMSRMDGMTPRPFGLLHGDLHRANLIVDKHNALWTIDWELAMIGDPLYDLATHLHLMRYPGAQEEDVIARWAEEAEKVRPGAAAGMGSDLPRYLAFKRIQSVYTDVIRQACMLEVGETSPAEAAKAINSALDRAAEAFQLDPVATGEIEQELLWWLAGPRVRRAADTGGSPSAS